MLPAFQREICKDGQSAYKRSLAYERLGINPRDVERMPFLRTELRRIARHLRSAQKDCPDSAGTRPLDYLRSSDDPEARKVLCAYLAVPESYRKLLPVEAFCLAAGVSPWRVLESIVVVAVRQGAQGSAILASIVHTRIVEKTIERALQDDGFRERALLHKAVGFI
jgi:hypothetical protein